MARWGVIVSEGWIPAFAGMTGKKSGNDPPWADRLGWGLRGGG